MRGSFVPPGGLQEGLRAAPHAQSVLAPSSSHSIASHMIRRPVRGLHARVSSGPHGV